MTIRPVTAELFHAGGRTDCRKDRYDEANCRFSQFCESVKLIYCIDKDSVRNLPRTQYANIRKVSWLMICTEITVFCRMKHKKIRVSFKMFPESLYF